jgi:hypothetical protein
MTTTIPTPTTASALLLTAADLIEKRGKARGVFEDANGCLCAIGALRLAAFGEIGDLPPDSELYQRARMALAAQIELLPMETQGQHVIGGKVSVVTWSDASTKAEVVAGLRAAVELAGTGVAS